jgi:hypothetical protein
MRTGRQFILITPATLGGVLTREEKAAICLINGGGCVFRV